MMKILKMYYQKVPLTILPLMQAVSVVYIYISKKYKSVIVNLVDIVPRRDITVVIDSYNQLTVTCLDIGWHCGICLLQDSRHYL